MAIYRDPKGRPLGRFRLPTATELSDDLLLTAGGRLVLRQADGSFLADAEAVRSYCSARGLKVPSGATAYEGSLGGRQRVGDRVVIRLPDDLLADLKAVAAARKLTTPEAARRAIRAGLGQIGGLS